MNEIKEIIRKNNFKLKKKFGQNFLIDKNVITKIVNEATIEPNSLVIEIGPGGAALTEVLSEKANDVLCYEIDESLKPVLNEVLKDKQNVKIIYDDFLNRNLEEDIRKYKYEHLYIIANLPYYITTPIIMKIIEAKINLDGIIIMVQKEVGERFNASIGTKAYNSLTVFLNYYFNIKTMMNVSREVFVPKPKVDSVVLKLTKKEKVNVLNEDLLFQLIRDAFQFKRKNIKNNLTKYDLKKIAKILEQYNFDLTVRSEKISLEIFIAIANELSKES